jgi:hypothetical protein
MAFCAANVGVYESSRAGNTLMAETLTKNAGDLFPKKQTKIVIEPGWLG